MNADEFLANQICENLRHLRSKTMLPPKVALQNSTQRRGGAKQCSAGLSSANFTWSAGSGVLEYWLFVGTSSGGTNIYSQSQGTNLSVAVSGIPIDGKTIYVRLWSRFDSGWQYNDYTYTATNAAVQAAMISPTPGTVLDGASATFTWSTGNGVSGYWLYVGTSSGGTNIYTQSQGTNHSVAVNGLPIDGRVVYVRPAYVSVAPSPSHDTPIGFYLGTVEGQEPTCATGYGFSLSIEAGGSGNWTTDAPNNPPLPLCGMASFSQNPRPISISASFNLAMQPNATSTLGVNVFNGSATLTTGSTPQTNLKPNGVQPADEPATATPVWLAVGLTITDAVNFVQFDAIFTDTNSAEGLLTVYWDTNQIGTVDERVAETNVQTYRFLLPSTAANNVYVLGFRLDSFDNTSSAVTVTNVATGFVGATQPINLGLSLTNGAPLLQLTAATNFTYLIQTSTNNLVDWTPTALLLNTNGTAQFLDFAVTNSSARFYRALLQ